MAESPVEDDAVRGVVVALRRGWSVRDVERSDLDTDFVAFLDVVPLEGDRGVEARHRDVVGEYLANEE